MSKALVAAVLKKNPDLAKFESKLTAMYPGAYCLHRSWGLGQIVGYDEATAKLVFNFKSQQNHSMDPVFCLDKMEVLDENSILVQSQKEPETIAALIKEEPVELIVKILELMPQHSANTLDIERILALLLDPEKAKKWWTSTKKALVRDPRISVPSKKTEPYVLREDLVSAEQEILEEFYLTKNPKKKILLAEKLHQLSNDIESIREDLPQVLEELTTLIRQAKLLSPAERLHGCWVRNDLARHLHANPEDLEPTSGSLLEQATNLSELVQTLPSLYHYRFLDLITRVFPEDWESLCLQLLKNSTGKFTGECISFLMEKEKDETIEYSLKKWLDEQSLKGPVLYWIIKNRQTKRFQPIIKQLMHYRLLTAVLQSIDQEALQNSTTRRIPLADLITEDKELIRDLLTDKDKTVAYDLAQILLLSQGIEDLAKKSILARFIKLFPHVQKLIASEPVKQSEQLIVSIESMEARKKEYELLVNKEIPENKEAIATAREHGDLRENSEYKMARQDQEMLLARKAQIESEMTRARVTDFKDAPLDQIAVGNIVEIQDKHISQTYAILGAWDSDPTHNILSYKTPLAQSLIGKKVGDTVVLQVGNTQQSWLIKSISRYVDQKKQP